MTATSGLTSPKQFAYYDHESSCWKMWPDIGLWGSIPYSQTWPKHGRMTCDGAVFELQMSAPPIAGSGFSSLLPTPTTQDGANNAGPSQFQRNSLPLNTIVTVL
jgi:hypothetical protein